MFKLKKLNNRGMTAVEILVCFVLMSILAVSMYSSIASYKNKQSIESAKEKIFTYKNLLTKEVQDELIKKGLVSAEISETINETKGKPEKLPSKVFKVDFLFRDGSKKQLVINRRLASDYSVVDCASEKINDAFSIQYGEEGNLMTYDLPDVGYGENQCGEKVLDLRINNVDINKDNNILTIYIGFYHPDLGTRYGIDIVCPINYF